MDHAKIASIEELEVDGKCVFLRASVRRGAEGGFDDAPLRAIVPSLRIVCERGGRAIVAAHVAPKSAEEALTLESQAEVLAGLLEMDVFFPDDCVGDARKMVQGNLRAGQVCMLENLARHAAEFEADVGFAQLLGRGADVYVNDAFPDVFETSASLTVLPRFVRERVAGRQLSRELGFAARLDASSPKGTCAIVSADEPLAAQAWLRALAGRANVVVVCGGLASVVQAAERLRRGAQGTAAAAAARSSLDFLESRGTRVVTVQREETAPRQQTAMSEFLSAASEAELAVWVDCSTGAAARDFSAGHREALAAFSKLPGFTALIGDSAIASLSRHGPEQLAALKFASTGSASQLKLVEGRRSVALEGLRTTGA